MDLINLSTNITAILQLTATVVNSLNDMKNSSKDQRRCAIEASNLFALLTSLKYRLEEATPDDPWYDRARTLGVENGPLGQYKSALEWIVSNLLPKDGSGKVVAAVLWQFNKGEAAKVFQTIERLKSLTSIALEMDHFKLSKAIQNETRHIPSIVQDLGLLRRDQDDQKSRAMVDWLTPVDLDSQQIDYSLQRQEGTGQWFLQSPEFIRWLNEGNSILFCPGIPGAGKTMISSLVIDHLRKTIHYRGAGVSYLYCDYKKDKQHSVVFMLAALLKQLVQGLPVIPVAIQALYDEHERAKSRPSAKDLSIAIREIISCYPEVFIIVDAVDECADEHRDALLSRLKSVQAPNVKLMITSRPIITISRQFEDAIVLEITAHREDIECFLEGQMYRLARCVSVNPGLKQLIVSDINDAAKGMFILAQLLLESLVDETTPKAIKLALKSLPKGSKALSKAYEGAIERIQNKGPGRSFLAKRVLSWIIWAKRPFRVKELQHALAIEVGERQLDEENFTEISDIVSVCAGLVTVDEQSDVVRLVHYTAYECLSSEWTDIVPTAQKDIAMACVTYLSFDIFRRGACKSKMQLRQRLASYDLYEYAAKSWGYHTLDASMETDELILKFLTNKEKVSASAEAMITSNEASYYVDWRVPRRIKGMHLAAYFGLKNTMVVLCEMGHYLLPLDAENRTPLYYAARNGQEEIVSWILDARETDLQQQDIYGQTLLSCAAAYGQAAVVKLLLAKDGVDLNSRSNMGQTPLSHATENGHEAVVELLLATDDVDPDLRSTTANHSKTPLMYAAQNGHETVVRLLLAQENIDVNAMDTRGRTPLSFASCTDEAVVKLLLERQGVNPNIRHKDDRTPLSLAAEYGQGLIVKRLLTVEGVDPDAKDRDERTPLSYAAAVGHGEVVSILLSADGVSPDSKDRKGRTPLSYAAERSWGAVANLLLTLQKVGPDSSDNHGRQPLSWAAVNESAFLASPQEAVVSLLLGHSGVDPNSKDSRGRTPLLYAAQRGGDAIVELFLADRRIDPNSRDNNNRTPLLHAAIEGRKRVVKLLLAESRVDPDPRDNKGRTPLSYAAEGGYTDIAIRLLKQDHVDPNAKDLNGLSPLSYAAGNRHLEMMKLLLSDGRIAVNSTTIGGQTLTMWVAEKFYRDIVVALAVDGDISPYFEEDNAWSLKPRGGYKELAEALFGSNSSGPYSAAMQDKMTLLEPARNWHEIVIRLLLVNRRSQGAKLSDEELSYEMMKVFLTRDEVNPNLGDEFGRTLLWWVARIGYETVARLLLGHGVDPEPRDKNGRTPLSCAAVQGNEMIVKLLLSRRDLHPDCKDNYGLTPLFLAAWKGHLAVMELLLADDRIDPNGREPRYNETPLHCAVSHGHHAAVRLLLMNDSVLPDPKNNHGETPLWNAACGGDKAVVQLLLADNRVDLMARDGKKGLTPLGAARRNGNDEVAKLLLVAESMKVDNAVRDSQT